MKIQFVTSYHLPSDTRVVVVKGRREATIYIDARHATPVLCEALTAAVEAWAGAEWMYMGDVTVGLAEAG